MRFQKFTGHNTYFQGALLVERGTPRLTPTLTLPFFQAARRFPRMTPYDGVSESANS